MMEYLQIFLGAILLRAMTALFPYSGYNTPPIFGDYEAQRHWMEVTVNMPVRDWYTFSEDYWRLDYPPLSAYHAWICGWIASWMDPRWVELEASKGWESPEHKMFMRITSLISDILVFFPSALLFAHAWSNKLSRRSRSMTMMVLAAVLLNPGHIVIDHGHFQYNSIMLGFALFSWLFFLKERYLVGAVFFCLALGFKQMALYYALPVFFFLLGVCWRRRGSDGHRLFLKLGLTVVSTFFILLAPFIYHGQVLNVVGRIFPVFRGLFEDKVANLWCTLDVIIKLRKLFSIPTLLRLSAAMTLFASLPPCLPLVLSPAPPNRIQKIFPYALAATSLAFFLLSFQVHEKSILIPLLPITLLYGEERRFVRWFMGFSVWSMGYLLVRDGCALASMALLGVWLTMTSSSAIFTKKDERTRPPKTQKFKFSIKRIIRWVEKGTTMAAMGIQLLQWTMDPPARYPHLWIVANVILSCGVFCASYVYLVWRIWEGVGWIGKGIVMDGYRIVETSSGSESTAADKQTRSHGARKKR